MERYDQIVKSLFLPIVTMPERLECKVVSDIDGLVEVKVLVDEYDLGRVIGKNGSIANAIRTIAYAGVAKYGKKIRIEIDSHK